MSDVVVYKGLAGPTVGLCRPSPISATAYESPSSISFATSLFASFISCGLLRLHSHSIYLFAVFHPRRSKSSW